MRKESVALLTVLILLSSTIMLGFGASYPINNSGSLGSKDLSLAQTGLTVESNGTIVVYGNAILQGNNYTTQFAGRGALFVSGNFDIDPFATLRAFNLSIVFVKNATLVNYGSVYLNNCTITSYNLSMQAYPQITIQNYGHFSGNFTSLEFLGVFHSYSSNVVLTNGYYGSVGLSFGSEFQYSNLVLYREAVYGNLFWNTSSPIGGTSLVNISITNGNLYSYDSFFNILSLPLKYSNTSTHPGGFISLSYSNAYFMNFSMPETPPANKKYDFPIYTTVGNAYFFDSVSVSLFTSEDYPVYDVPFIFTGNSSAQVKSVNTEFYENSFTEEFVPFPKTIGQNSILYALVDTFNASGLYIYNFYNLSFLGKKEMVLFPTFPIFKNLALSAIAEVPILYAQVSNTSVTFDQKSTILVNYTSDGSVEGTLNVSMGGQSIYSNHIQTAPGLFSSIPVSFQTTQSPGDYPLNVSFSGTSPYSFMPISIPVTVYQDFFPTVGVSSSYSMRSGAPFADVSVFVNVTGQFLSCSGVLNLSVIDNTGRHGYSSLIPLYPGMRSIFPFTVPVSEPNTQVIEFAASVTPLLSFALDKSYAGYLNQSLGAGLTGETYGVLQSGTGNETFYLNFSLQSLGPIDEWTLYQNDIPVESGNTSAPFVNVSTPVVNGANHMSLELNGASASDMNTSTSWQRDFNYSRVVLTSYAPPFILENQSSYLQLHFSVNGSVPIDDLRVFVNGEPLTLDSGNISVLIKNSTNVVSVYESVLGKLILVIEDEFNSTIIPLPTISVISALSLVGNYHLSVSVSTSDNVTIDSVEMGGEGSSYSHSLSNTSETFLIHSRFLGAGVLERSVYVTGTYRSLPFNISIPVNVTVLDPSYALEYVGSTSIQFGIGYVELREINLNGTGVFEPATVTVSGSSILGTTFTHSYDVAPDSNGVVKVPLPLNIGNYRLSFRIGQGSGASEVSVQHAVNIELLVLPFWAYIAIIVSIAAGSGGLSYIFVRRSHGTRKLDKVFVCYNCGKSVPYDAKLCPNCRVKFADQVKCGDCGSEISRNMQYCPYCGNVMGQGFKLSNYLKKKYRQYVAENRKEVEQSFGKVGDDVFWKRLAKGELPIQKFEEFRSKFLASGKYQLKGVAQCPVCGSGNLVSDESCAICGAPMHLITDYERRAKG